MATQNDRIEFTSIKAAALDQIEPSCPPTLQSELSKPDRLEAIQNAFYSSVAATTFAGSNSKRLWGHRPASPPAKPLYSPEDSLLYLAGAVPESVGASNVESDIPQSLPFALQSQVLQAVKKMNSQGALHDTQPLSPDVIADIISKSKSVLHSVQQPQGAENGEEGHDTLQEGDAGHVDLLSSYMKAGEFPDDELDLEPVNFSPTQTQHRRSPFPESQRFKTPATVGKKRKYNGEIIDSPALPRNPFARKGEATPAKTMGLSQAFAATQAGSSPLVNGILSELPSDRPSPNIGLQARPTTASLSSPLVSKNDGKRTSTEPYDRYVSLRQSQAGRKRQVRAPMAREDLHTSDDEFVDDDSWSERERWKRERETKARAQFEALSSAVKASSRGDNLTMSSPIRKELRSSPRSSPRTYGRGTGHVSMPQLFSDHETTANLRAEPNDSEAETEPEDHREEALRRSKQLQRNSDEEIDLEADKENFSNGVIQVPETTLRVQHVMEDFAEVEASPSVRHSSAMAGPPRTSQVLDGPEQFAVADSQPSQSRRRPLNDSTPNVVSSGQGTEIVPQSQISPEDSIDHLSLADGEQILIPGDVADVTTRHDDSLLHHDDLSLPKLPINRYASPPRTVETPDQPNEQNTTSETSSTELKDASSRIAQCEVPTLAQKTCATIPLSRSASDFETAPTHATASSGNASNLRLPLPPLSNAKPVTGKRRRMVDIAADPSPEKSSGLDLNVMLATVQDPEFDALIGDSSPIAPGRNTKKRRLNLPRAVSTDKVESNAANDQPVEKTVNKIDLPRDANGASPVLQTADAADIAGRQESSIGAATGTPDGPRCEPARRTTGRNRLSRIIWEPPATPEKPRPAKNDRATASTKEVVSMIPVQKKSRASVSSQDKRRSSTQTPTTTAPAETSSDLGNGIEQAFNAPGAESRGLPAGDIVAPNQVFACFNGKSRAYYPATCVGVSGSDKLRYQIQWEGYDPDEIDAHGVRCLDLRTGDTVKVNLEGFPKVSHVIRGFKDLVAASIAHTTVTDVRGYRTVFVAPKQRSSLPAILNGDAVREVPVAAIYLDNNMWGQMKDRHFEYTPVALPQSGINVSTPTERPSTPSTPSSRSRRVTASVAVAPPLVLTGIFSNMAFAISYDDPSRKNSLSHAIESNGGIIVTEGFHELLDAGTSLKSRFAGLGFTALLADRHSRKEKYMQALALNLPCLGGRWIGACLARQELVDWQPYLLPAGESQELEGAVRSRTMGNFDARNIKLSAIIAARPNIFSDSTNIIMVTGRGKAEEKRKPYLFLTETLGASTIERATDLHAAKALADADNFDWLFVDDHDVSSAKSVLGKQHKNVKVAGNQLIVQSLILGRLYEG